MNTARVFRLFISSTFSDFVAEREALQRRVFPVLEAFCRERGAAFQAVDLRWGITEEAQRDHDTMRICLEEVRRCQALTPRPNFVVLLGDRYGWEPVPARIPADHWKRLMAAATPDQRRTLRAGYRGPDRNAVPPVHHLRPHGAPGAHSGPGESVLRDALRAAAQAAGFEGDERLPYFASATHQEIALGALAREDAQGQALRVEDHVSVYLRRIEGLPRSEAARAFIDWDAATGEPVTGARERLRALESELTARLPGRVHTFHTRWSGQGIDTAYLDDFCGRFLQDQQAVIERELSQAMTEDAPLARDRAHTAFARDRARNFRGRSALRRRMARYLAGSVQAPLIVHGEGGTGKSALMAQAFQDAIAARGLPGNTVEGTTPRPVVMARFIGGVPGCESLYALLTSLTADIARAYGQADPPRAQDLRSARAAFETVLSASSAQQPLFLFLDALDQLERQDGAWMLDWLPASLGPHTRLVASTRGGPVLAAARRRYPRTLVEVPAMSAGEGRQMLQAWLQDAREAHYNAGIAPSRGRRLTPRQQQAVLESFAVSGKPLWLKLAYEEARTWASWHGADDPACLRLPGTVEAMVRTVIGARLLEGGDHPQAFAAQALACITAARMGLSEEELGHALATSPAVRREFEAQVARTGQHWQDAGKLPPILWSRLYFDLQPYLTWARIDGALLCRWFHREFKEEVERQLLADDAQRREVHAHLARTFEQRAPQGADAWRFTDASGQPQAPALRRVMEQPWQLVRAGAFEAAARLLLDFGFCMAKCAANRARDLFLDVTAVAAHAAGGDASPLHALEGFLRTRLHVLERGDAQWPAHRILLQLATDYGQDNPVTRAARAWMATGQPDWPRLEKVVYRPEAPRTGVRWVASEHAHHHGFLSASGVRCEGSLLWSWDTRHLCHWDPASGEALHIEALPADGRLLPLAAHALWVARDQRTCALHDPMTGERLWTRRLTSPLREAYPVGEDGLALVDGVETHLVGLVEGEVRDVVSHAHSGMPRSRWKRMAVTVLGGRWLAYQYAPRRKSVPRPVACTFSLAVHDLHERRPVFAGDIAGTLSSMGLSPSFVSEDNPLGLRLAGEQLMLWGGHWRVLDLALPEAGLRDLEAMLRAKVPTAGQEPRGIHYSHWEVFVPVAANDDYQVFKFAHLLVAWQPRSGRVLHRVIDPQVHRDAQSIRWGGSNALVVLGHDRSRAVDASKNFRWRLEDDTVAPVRVPALQRPVILASRGELLILSRDHRYDTNQGDYAQPEPLVAHDLRTGTSTVFHVMNRVVGYTSMFRHAWLASGELAVLDGDHLTCLRVDQGVPWEDYAETSLGSMLSVVEDWKHPDRFAIIGNRRLLHIDLGGESPALQTVDHPFEWGATGELAGDALFLWEDDNAMSETGMPGQFGLWRQEDDGGWALDPETHMEFLCAEAPDFDMMSSYSATHAGGSFLVGQDGVIHSFGVDASGMLVLQDTLRGPFQAITFWVRGTMLYMPDAEDEDWVHAASFSGGTFGPLTRMARSDLLQAGETAFVNVRPFRDLALGPLRGSRLFVVGEPVDGWTAWDGAFEGQSRDHVCFTGPDGQEARWHAMDACRILRHRIDYRHLPGRDLFEPFGREPEDVHSLVVEGGVYFVCEEDGSAWMVKLVTPEASSIG